MGTFIRATAGLVLMAAVLTFAGPAYADTDLEVTTPADGRYQSGQPVPLLITVSADRAVSGVLSVEFDGIVAGSKRVEVPGGSTKQVVMVVNLPPWEPGGSIGFDADNSDDDASGRLGLTANREDELVAVFDDLAVGDVPPTADLRVDMGQARLFRFDPGLLAEGPDMLGPFSHVVVTAGDLAALDPAAIGAIEVWAGSTGGTIVVDESPTADVALSVRPAAGEDEVPFGTGSVWFTDGRIAESGFDGLFAPSPTRNADEFPWSGGGGGVPSSITLARDAGVAIPEIGSLMLVLMAYVVIAGPVLWLVLRRSKREPLVWAALPALALLTTGGVWLVGQNIRNDTNAAHATVVADLPNLRSVSTEVLVSAPNGGRAGLTLDDGWRPLATFTEEFFDGPFGGGNVRAETTLDGDLLTVDLPPGGLQVVGATAALPGTADPSWAIDMTDVNGRLEGTITNLTPYRLDEVFVVAGQGFATPGPIEPGGSADISLQNAHLPPTGSDRLMEQMWRFDPWNPDVGSSSVNPGTFMQWLNRNRSLRAPGFVMVGGWTTEAEGPLATHRGNPVDDGRTALITTERIGATGGEPYQLELLRGWNSTQVTDRVDPNECVDFPATIRFNVDRQALGDEPVLDLTTRSVAAFDLWDGESWEPAGLIDAPDERVIVAIPEAALADDSLYLRMQMSCGFWEFANPFPDVRDRAPDDEVHALGVLDEDPAESTEEQEEATDG
ncbi:MAG: hypothetical protein AAGD35_05055 [Actinomycetota bacterium]